MDEMKNVAKLSTKISSDDIDFLRNHKTIVVGAMFWEYPAAMKKRFDVFEGCAF